MNNGRGRVLAKAFLFVFLLGILILASAGILEDAGNESWEAMANVHAYPNSYDVCFLGPSTAKCNVSNQELYEQYGIAGISLAEDVQPIYAARYTLEEVLNYQSPQAVFYDVSPMFYSEQGITDWTQERQNYLLDSFLGGIKTPPVRWNAFEKIRYYNKDVKIWDYLRFPYIHENWVNIVTGEGKNRIPGNATGNQVLLDQIDNLGETDAGKEYQSARVINADAEKYLREMSEICSKRKTELVLLCEKVFSEWEHEAVSELAEKYGIKFIDINEHLEEIGFSYQEDLQDGSHFNLSGAVKWTDYIGKYISENYEITDKRNDSSYRRFEEGSALFAMQKESLSNPVFEEYLEMLVNLDKKENVIFVSVYDEATNALTAKNCELLRELGLETDLRGQYQSSYAAVIHESGIQEMFAPEDTVKIQGNIDGLYYRVMSGGLLSGNRACIELNGVNYMQMGRGVNFVVCNLKTGEITDSVFFDTYASANAHLMRKTEEFQNRKAEFPAGTFRDYLMKLAELDTGEYAVFVSVYDEATTSLEEIDVTLMRAIGLETDLRGQNRCSYAAVLCDSKVQERFAPEDTVTIEGNIGSLSYKVMSGGLSSGGNAGIRLNGTEYIQKGRGFNFVIYNLETERVEESVSFDTYAIVNPPMETTMKTKGK